MNFGNFWNSTHFDDFLEFGVLLIEEMLPKTTFVQAFYKITCLFYTSCVETTLILQYAVNPVRLHSLPAKLNGTNEKKWRVRHIGVHLVTKYVTRWKHTFSKTNNSRHRHTNPQKLGFETIPSEVKG